MAGVYESLTATALRTAGDPTGQRSIAAVKADYMNGRIEADEMERRIAAVLAAVADGPTWANAMTVDALPPYLR